MTNEEKALPGAAPEPAPENAPQTPLPTASETREAEFPKGASVPAQPGAAPAEVRADEVDAGDDADEAEDAQDDGPEDEAEDAGPEHIAEAAQSPSQPGEGAPPAPQGAPQPGNQPGAQPGQAGALPQRHGRRRRRRGRGGAGRQEGQRPPQQGGQDAQRPPQGGQEQRREPRPDQGQPGQGQRSGQGQGQRHDQRRDQRHDQRSGAHAQRPRHERRETLEADRHERGTERLSGRAQKSAKKVKREILANSSFEESRIAILEDGRLTELLWERKSEESIVGNIYKGQVENVLPGISSAFVNIGFEKNAYLYISDVLGDKGAAIDSTLKKGQHIMVQVAKEAIGTKGMKVTMDVSLPGRYLVFTPFQTFVGVSKHIEDSAERERLTAIVDELVATQLQGKGVVVRTEAEGASREDLEREVKYLLATWTSIQKKFDEAPPPAMLHEDLDLTLQVARDILSDEVYVYLLDSKEAYKHVIDFVNELSPELKDRVRLYEGKTPIFKAFSIEPEIEGLRRTKVPLPNGGSIVIQEAESLCAIDVNTGRFTGSKSQEETVTVTNIEAALEVAHQIRLRNIGGIIVVDFIDMKKASSRNRVMDTFAQACRGDRAKIRILPITRLGLIELTRERKRESTVTLITDECAECHGSGRLLSAETLRIRIQREILELTAGRPGGQTRILLHPSLAEQFRAQQATIEKNVQRSVKIQGDPSLPREDYKIVLE